MRTFRFRLQSLLGLREREERKALEAFAAALREAELAESRLKSIQDRINDHWDAAAEALRSGCAPAEIQSWQSFGQILVREEVRCRASAVTASESATQARRSLLVARQRREVVESKGLELLERRAAPDLEERSLGQVGMKQQVTNPLVGVRWWVERDAPHL